MLHIIWEETTRVIAGLLCKYEPRHSACSVDRRHQQLWPAFLSALGAYPPQLVPTEWKCSDRVRRGGEQLRIPSKSETSVAPAISEIAHLKPGQVRSYALHCCNFQERSSWCFLCYLCPRNENSKNSLPFPASKWLCSLDNCLQLYSPRSFPAVRNRYLNPMSLIQCLLKSMQNFSSVQAGFSSGPTPH